MRRIFTALLVALGMSLLLTPSPAASAESAGWMKDVEAGRTLARKTGRPLLVYVLDEV